MDIAIAGGGIGGLTLALCLEREGFRPTVYEQSPRIKELGVGINTLPHAIKELANLGLLDRLDAVGIRTKELIYKTAAGQDILRQPRGTWAGYDVPQFSIHRGMLQKVLLDAVIERLGADAVVNDRRLAGFEQDAHAVRATFVSADGAERTVRADVLVGADGIHSVVRAARGEDHGPPRWSGIVMWRGATWTTPFLDGRTMIIAGGLKSKLVLYPIHESEDRPGETLMNWVICARLAEDGAPLTLIDDWSKRGDLDEVMRHVDGIIHIDELDIPALIRATPEFYIYPMADRDPLSGWTTGRVTVMGDAAHPMYPVGSNGASQAILDAVSMSGHLARDGVAGLMRYDEERRPMTAEIVRANRKGGPERVIDLVEERAPDGFTDLDDVASPDELRAIVGDYQSMAGFAADQVNR
jgi:2-polyprenyl-6-methoxyphenol hydroxylase-like FAD-dependent oxidoreductase